MDFSRSKPKLNSPDSTIRFVKRAVFGFNILVGSYITNASEGTAAEILVDRIVAEVNGDIITHSEVLKKIRRGNVIEVSAYPAERTSTPFEIALSDLINKKLVIQKVESADIDVTDETVEEEISEFLTKRGTTREALISALDQEGMTYEEYASDFKQSLLIRNFQGRFIIPAIKISEKDIELHYFRFKGSQHDGVKLKLRQIFLALSNEDSPQVKESKQQVLDKVLVMLSAGESFSDLAKIYSDAPNAAENGGELPLVTLSDLSPEIQGNVESLEKGQYGTPLATARGIFLFYLDEKVLSDSSDFKAQRQEIEYDLRTREIERETIKWLESQRVQSKIRRIPD